MPATTDTPTYLRPHELAVELHLTTRTLCRWRKDGVGPAFVQQGRIVRYKITDLESWASTNRHPGA